MAQPIALGVCETTTTAAETAALGFVKLHSVRTYLLWTEKNGHPAYDLLYSLWVAAIGDSDLSPSAMTYAIDEADKWIR